MKYGAFQSLKRRCLETCLWGYHLFSRNQQFRVGGKWVVSRQSCPAVFTPKLEVLTPRTLHDFGMFLDVTFWIFLILFNHMAVMAQSWGTQGTQRWSFLIQSPSFCVHLQPRHSHSHVETMHVHCDMRSSTGVTVRQASISFSDGSCKQFFGGHQWANLILYIILYIIYYIIYYIILY